MLSGEVAARSLMESSSLEPSKSSAGVKPVLLLRLVRIAYTVD